MVFLQIAITNESRTNLTYVETMYYQTLDIIKQTKS